MRPYHNRKQEQCSDDERCSPGWIWADPNDSECLACVRFFMPPGGYPDGAPPFFHYLTHPSTVRRSNRCGTPRELHVDLVGQLQDVASSVIAFRKSISCRMMGSPPEGWCMWLCLLFFSARRVSGRFPPNCFVYAQSRDTTPPSLVSAVENSKTSSMPWPVHWLRQLWRGEKRSLEK